MKKNIIFILAVSFFALMACDKNKSNENIVHTGKGYQAFQTYDLFQKQQPELASHFSLFGFENIVYTHKSHVQLKGKNNLLSPTFVNKKPITIREDGRFLIHVPLDVGWNVQHITFQELSGSLMTFKRYVYRYNLPNSLTNLSTTSFNMARFVNSDLYLRDPVSDHQFTRQHMAFLLYRLRSLSNGQPLDDLVNIRKVIRLVIHENLMSLYYDGQFHGAKVLSYRDGVVYLAKTLYEDYFMDSSISDFDTDPYIWAKQTLEDQGVWVDSIKWEQNNTLGLGSLINLVKQVPMVRSYLDEMFVDLPVEDSLHLSNVISFIQDQFSTDTLLAVLPKKIDITEEANLLPSLDIEAKKEQLDDALTDVASGNLKIIRVFSDLKKHWARRSVSGLDKLGVELIFNQDSDYFHPNHNVSRGEFALVIYKNFLKDRVLNDANKIAIQGLPPSSPYYKPMQALVSAGIISKTRNNGYHVTRPLKRYEGVTMAVRLSLFLSPHLEKKVTPRLNFVDIKRYKWLRTYLEYATQHKLLNNYRYFRPRHSFNRAQLATMMYRLPYIQNQLQITPQK